MMIDDGEIKELDQDENSDEVDLCRARDADDAAALVMIMMKTTMNMMMMMMKVLMTVLMKLT